MGIVLEEARVKVPGAGPWRPVRDLLDMAPITITPAGHVRVPADLLDPSAEAPDT